MAKCETCGKTTKFGRSRPWSKKTTKRKFKPNLQKVTVYEDGKKIRKTKLRIGCGRNAGIEPSPAILFNRLPELLCLRDPWLREHIP